MAVRMYVGNFKRGPCSCSIWSTNVTRIVERLGPCSVCNTVGTEDFGTYKVNGVNFLAVIAIVNRYLLGFEVIGNYAVRFSGTAGFIGFDETLPFSVVSVAYAAMIFAAYMAIPFASIHFVDVRDNATF